MSYSQYLKYFLSLSKLMNKQANKIIIPEEIQKIYATALDISPEDEVREDGTGEADELAENDEGRGAPGGA